MFNGVFQREKNPRNHTACKPAQRKLKPAQNLKKKHHIYSKEQIGQYSGQEISLKIA